jgi:hypothetical protein
MTLLGLKWLSVLLHQWRARGTEEKNRQVKCQSKLLNSPHSQTFSNVYGASYHEAVE